MKTFCLSHAYILRHERELDEDTSEIKLIGIFSSEEEAKIAIDILKNKDGFKDYPDDFTIGKYKINETHWAEGFVSTLSEENRLAADGEGS